MLRPLLQIAELNEPGAAAARLVLAGTTEPSVKLPGLIERHLMTAGRKSVLVFLPESEQERKSKRQRELPADVKYDGSLSGRSVSMQHAVVAASMRLLPLTHPGRRCGCA